MRPSTLAFGVLAGLVSGAMVLPAAAIPPPVPGTETAALAVVNGDTVAVADLLAALSEIDAASQGAARVPRPTPDGVLKRLIQNRLLEQEARRIELHTRPVVRNQVRDLVRSESVKVLLDSLVALPPGSRPGSAAGGPPIVNTMKRFSHILVASRDLARALQDSLAAGTSFADLARRHSTDGNAARGGDLGWAARGAYVPAFEAAADTLGPGEVSHPVETEFGWHLITLTEARSDTMRAKEMLQAIDDSREKERVDEKVGELLASLRRKYAISVDEKRLAGLDYGSEDPEVQSRLSSSDDVLVRLPTGPFTVRDLTRNIRFTNFHGIAGRADAAEIRDRVFQQSLAEALLTHEAWSRGYRKRPDIVAEAALFEKRLLREEMLRELTTFDFSPPPSEIAAYHESHLDRFSSAPRVKVRSLLLGSEKAATQFRDQLASGADFQWLADRTPRVDGAGPPFPTDWMAAGELGIEGPLVAGQTLGPIPRPDGWAVALVTGVEEPAPIPLEQCRGRVMEMMRAERGAAIVESAVRRLEESAEIETAEGAIEVIAGVLDAWQSGGTEGTRP